MTRDKFLSLGVGKEYSFTHRVAQSTIKFKIDCDVLFGSDVADTVSRKVMYDIGAFATGGQEFLRSKDFVLAHSQILQEIEKKPIDEGFTQIFQSGHGNVEIISIIAYY